MSAKGCRQGRSSKPSKRTPPFGQFFKVRGLEWPILSKKSDTVVHIVDGNEENVRFGFFLRVKERPESKHEKEEEVLHGFVESGKRPPPTVGENFGQLG